MNLQSKKYLFKIICIGNAAAGKTSLLRRYVDDKFDDSTIHTVGLDFFVKQVDFDTKDVTLQLWDFGGQKRFRYMIKNYVMGARAAILLVDLTRMPEMREIVEWVNIARMHDIDLPILLVGSKADLKDFIAVDDETMNDIKNTFNMIDYIKTSAKTGKNVDKAFRKVAKKLVSKSKR